MKIAITGSNSLLGLYFTNYFTKKRFDILEMNKDKSFYLDKKIPFNFKRKKN